MNYLAEKSPYKKSLFFTKLLTDNNFLPIDYFIAEWLGEKRETFFCLGLLLSKRLREGFIFIDEEYWRKEKKVLEKNFSYQLPKDFSFLKQESQEKRFILEDKVVYFKKYWEYQQRIINLVKKNQQIPAIKEKDNNKENLNNLDKKQKQAITTALHYPMSIISGGPGTGKTYLIGKILEKIAKNFKNKKVALLSFTGKAVRRIKEQLADKSGKELIANCYLYNGIFVRISTIHSMLQNKNSYSYHKELKEFDWDFLVLDETSMISLSLIAKVLKKTAKKTKIIFIGDHQQLNPIEAGYFFFDLSLAMKKTTPPYFVLLDKNYRYEKKGNITGLIENLFFQTSEKSNNYQHKDIIFFKEKKGFYQKILEKGKKHWKALYHTKEPKEAFMIYYKFVILCSLNISDFGVNKILQEIQQELFFLHKGKKFYNGRPLLIEVNTPSLGIYNGDIGICLKKNGVIRVYFARLENSFFSIPYNELPQHKSAYAMSIHKAQGSEFEEVLICLPESKNELVKKELLYTAITRAKKTASILSNKEILEKALATSYQPTTNLIKKLVSEK